MYKNKPAARPASVISENSTRAVVERQYILMNQAEYVRRFGGRHLAKDPRCPVVRLPGFDGGEEDFYVFEAAGCEHRMLKLQSVLAECQEKELLSADDHLHGDQAIQMHTTATSTRLTKTCLNLLLSPQSWSSLSYVDEFEASHLTCM